MIWLEVIFFFNDTATTEIYTLSLHDALPILLPHVESGAVRLVGEVPARAYEQLLRLRPRLRTAMQTCRVAPPSDEETLELGRRWAGRGAKDEEDLTEAQGTSPRASERTLCEALQLA